MVTQTETFHFLRILDIMLALCVFEFRVPKNICKTIGKTIGLFIADGGVTLTRRENSLVQSAIFELIYRRLVEDYRNVLHRPLYGMRNLKKVLR